MNDLIYFLTQHIFKHLKGESSENCLEEPSNTHSKKFNIEEGIKEENKGQRHLYAQGLTYP